LQQHPLLAGIAGGLAGTWIGHMLFGAMDSSARTTETDARDKGQETDAGSGGSMGLILILMLLAGGIWYYVMRARRTPQPDFSGMGRSSFGGAALTAPPSSSAMTSGSTDLEIGAADKAAFQQLLTEIQDAWSKQDLTTLRRLTTPEMLSYFNAGLSENASQEVENRIEDLTLISAELREAWREDGSDYATVLFRWKAKDYTLSLTKKRDEPGAIVDGTDQALTETSEVWTFMRYQQGKWLLSAIQQIE
jgi:predicted lipid-binding transport protein (Tim44 family)